MNQQEAIQKVLEVIAECGHEVDSQMNNGADEFIDTDHSGIGHYAEVMIDSKGRIDVAFGRGRVLKALKEIAK